MKNTEILMNLGLSEPETKAYIASLKLGGAQASTIAKEMGVKRTTVYAILKMLASKGLVSVYFRKNKRVYHALPPHKLSGLFEKKLEALNSIIPVLKSLEKKTIQSFGLRFIETKEELEIFYNETITGHKNEEYYVIGNVTAWESLDPDFLKLYREQRAINKIKTKLLLSAGSKKDNPTSQSLLREFKYLPDKYNFKSTINIFNDKILIVNPDIGSLAVVIAIPAMTDIFKSIFEIIWDSIN